MQNEMNHTASRGALPGANKVPSAALVMVPQVMALLGAEVRRHPHGCGRLGHVGVAFRWLAYCGVICAWRCWAHLPCTATAAVCGFFLKRKSL